MNRASLRTALLTAAALTLWPVLAGCFAPPAPPPPVVDPAEPSDARFNARVATALGGDAESARQYAAFYRLLADRLAAGDFDGGTDLAAVAGRAAELLALPGRLSGIVAEELDPILNPPGPLSPERRVAAASAFDRLADACEEAVR